MLESHQHDRKTNLTVEGKKKERKAVSDMMSKEIV